MYHKFNIPFTQTFLKINIFAQKLNLYEKNINFYVCNGNLYGFVCSNEGSVFQLQHDVL